MERVTWSIGLGLGFGDEGITTCCYMVRLFSVLSTTMSHLGKERIKAKEEPEVWRKQKDIGTRYLNDIKTQKHESIARNL